MIAPVVACIIPYRPDSPERERNHEVVRARLREIFPFGLHIDADNGDTPFTEGRTLNEVIAHLRDVDVLLINGADCVHPETNLRAAVNQAVHSGRLHLPFTQLAALTDGGTADFLDDRPYDMCETDYVVGNSTGGAWILTPESWHRAGGVDPRFQGWGHEDVAFRIATENLLGPAIRHEGTTVHLWHPTVQRRGSTDHTRDVELGARYEQANTEGREAVAALVDEHRQIPPIRPLPAYVTA